MVVHLSDGESVRPGGLRPLQQAAVPRLRLRLRLGIRAWMLLVSLLSALPLLAYSVVATHRLITEQHLKDQQTMQQRAAAGALAVRHRLDQAVAALQALAASDAARAADVEALYRQAARIQALHPDALSIGLARADGELVFTTRQPLGVPLPRTPAAALERPLFDETREGPVFTPAFVGAVTKRLVVAVGVRLRTDRHGLFALHMTLPVEALDGVMAEQRWPADWIVALVDQHDIVLTRSREAQRFVGTPAPEAVRAAIAQGRRDVFDGITKEGIPVKGHVVEVPGTGWHVAVGTSKAAFSGELRHRLAVFAASGVACLLAGAAGGMLVARVVTGQVRQLAVKSADPGAAPVAGAGPAGGARSAVREVDAVTAALTRVRHRERTLTERLRATRHDALTGLLTRAPFLDAAGRLLARIRSEPDLALAVLFIDLDGFKSINDRFGHDAGDGALRQAARVIAQVVRADDVAGRFGGDEFVVCMAAPAAAIEVVCRTVAARLVEQIAAIGQGLGCNVGIAVGSGAACTLDRLLADADEAMLQAKRTGKNRFMRFGAASAGLAEPVVCRACAAPEIVGPAACRGCGIAPRAPGALGGRAV